MDKVVSEVIISVFICMLLIMVIGLFRGNMEIGAASAEQVSRLEKLRKDSLVPVGKDTVSGSDVVSVIRYYAADASVRIQVTVSGIQKTYQGKTYETDRASPDYFEIPYEQPFQAEYVYQGEDLAQIRYTGL